MKALVTGATGFLGGHLARSLAAQGWDVVGGGRDLSKGEALEKDGVSFQAVDLADKHGVDQLCHGQDVVFHCGGLSSAWGKRDAFRLANIEGTRHIIAGSVAHAVGRLVHVSTPSLYFNGPSRLNVKEDDRLPATPVNHYAWSKIKAEELVAEARSAGLSTVVLRPRAIYGPGDTALFPRLVRALKTGRLRRIGDGQNVQNLTHVSNVVHALLLAATVQDLPAQPVYNVTDGEEIKIWDLIARIGEHIGIPLQDGSLSPTLALGAARVLETTHRILFPDQEPILTRYAALVLSSSQTLDISAIRRDLGYAPLIDTQAGIEQTLADIDR